MEPRNALEDVRTKAAAYVVEASSAERLMLWREYSEQAKAHEWGTPSIRRIDWGQDYRGWLATVGHLAGFPVTVSISYATLAGVLVVFWEPESRVVDHDMCEAWLREHVPAYAEHHCNADNFGHCLSFVDKVRTPAESPAP